MTPIATAWSAYQESISARVFCALWKAIALLASWWGTEWSPVEPPDRTSALAFTWREKLVIMSRKESAALPPHGPLSPASALAWSTRLLVTPSRIRWTWKNPLAASSSDCGLAMDRAWAWFASVATPEDIP